ncbi:MAG: transketolase [Lachnospiraceae bacterium]|nr:transketolase [Lachnospiraceae bacterium]
MRNRSTQMVYDLIKQDKRVLAVTADNRNEIFDEIRVKYPKQYIDYGIAEENMIASCAGLATCGYIPFLYTITNFMSMHAFEFIRNDVCIGNRNVKFLGRSSGLVSCSMGATHQGTEELALLRTLPNMITITPATPIEAREATRFAYEHEGPVYIRLEGFNEPELFDDGYIFDGMGGVIRVREGTDISIFVMGSIINEALSAAEELQNEKGISVEVINVPSVRPIKYDQVANISARTGNVITLEEHSIYGGLGTVIAEILARHKVICNFKMLGLDCCATGCGNRNDMRIINHISKDDLKRVCMDML